MIKKILLLSSIIALAIFAGNAKFSDDNKEPTHLTTKLERAINGNTQRQQAEFNSLPQQLQTLIKNTFTLDSYQIFENKTGEIVAANRAQNLKASFSQDKTQIMGTRSSNSWELNLNLTGFGWQDEIKSVEPGVLNYEKNRVEIKRPSLTEWFVNDTRGLEQGFTINAPPTGQGTQLVLQLSVNSNLQSQISENKKDISLSNKAGQSIDYSGLIAEDAQGKELNTWFESQETPKGTTWQIFVDVKDAQFPIIVDPVINEDHRIMPADPENFGQFGFSVAISGNTVIAGSVSDNDPIFGSNAGSAYIFVKDPSGIWTQQAKLLASDAATGDGFGNSVAIEGDTAVVGAENNSLDDVIPGLGFAGSAYVFVRNGTVWTEQQRLIASDLASDTKFGECVDISGDTIAVLAPGDVLPLNQGFIDGSVYIFVRDTNGVWNQQTKLKSLPTTPPGSQTGGTLRLSVAISGNTVVVGNPDEKNTTGAARVFVRTGITWSEQANLTANDGSAQDFFGFSVDVHNDTAIIGSPFDDDNGSQSGSAYIFVRDTNGIWSQQAKLLANDGKNENQFGTSVSISEEIVLVSAPSRRAAYTFERTGTTWSQQLKLLASDLTLVSDFGNSVALSGKTAFVGSRADSFPGLIISGSGYIFNVFCQKDLGFQGPGNLELCVCGEDLTQDGSKATVTITGAPPSSPIFIVLGFNNTPTPFAGGTIVPSQDLILGPFTTDTEGIFKLPLTGGTNTPITLFLQAGGFDGAVFEISNAVEVKIGF